MAPRTNEERVRIAKQIMAQIKEREALVSRYKDEHPEIGALPFDRMLLTFMDMSGTPEADEKNVKMMRYMATPEGMMAYRAQLIRDAQSIDPSIYCSDDIDKALDYELEHPCMMLRMFDFTNTTANIKTKVGSYPIVDKYIDEIRGITETANDGYGMIRLYAADVNIDAFSKPIKADEITQYIVANNGKLSPEQQQVLVELIDRGEENTTLLRAGFEKMEKMGIDIHDIHNYRYVGTDGKDMAILYGVQAIGRGDSISIVEKTAADREMERMIANGVTSGATLTYGRVSAFEDAAYEICKANELDKVPVDDIVELLDGKLFDAVKLSKLAEMDGNEKHEYISSPEVQKALRAMSFVAASPIDVIRAMNETDADVTGLRESELKFKSDIFAATIAGVKILADPAKFNSERGVSDLTDFVNDIKRVGAIMKAFDRIKKNVGKDTVLAFRNDEGELISASDAARAAMCGETAAVLRDPDDLIGCRINSEGRLDNMPWVNTASSKFKMDSPETMLGGLNRELRKTDNAKRINNSPEAKQVEDILDEIMNGGLSAAEKKARCTELKDACDGYITKKQRLMLGGKELNANGVKRLGLIRQIRSMASALSPEAPAVRLDEANIVDGPIM